MNKRYMHEEDMVDDVKSVKMLDMGTHVNIFMNEYVCEESIGQIMDAIISYNMIPDSVESEEKQEDVEVVEKPKVINLFIDSPGGHLDPAMKLIDVMRMSKIPIRTIGWGGVSSSALMILMAGSERFVSRTVMCMSHAPSIMLGEDARIRVNDKALDKQKDILLSNAVEHYRKYTKQDKDFIVKKLLTSDDVFFNATEAIDYGIADRLIPENLEWMSKDVEL